MRLFYLNPVRLFCSNSFRRSVGLAVLLLFSVPFGLSISGCKHAAAVDYCNAGDSGPVVGQVASISLSPGLATTGESLNYGQIGQSLSASGLDCKGNSVSISHIVYATSNMQLADINPNTGSVCGGTWNRNSGGGIADYTTCTAAVPTAACAAAPNNPGCYTAYVTATSSGAVSNAIPVFIHPVVTGVLLGGASTSCTLAAGTDPGTDCCPNSTTGAPITAPIYTGGSCISQGGVRQLVARVYAGTGTAPANNITCQVGHLSFSAQTAGNVVAIDNFGVATANQPGSTEISTLVSNSSSAISSGYFATCPPASITLSIPGQPAGTSSIAVAINNTQPLTAVVKDTNGVTITGLSLEFNSTTPQTIPASVGSVTPVYPGTATITAVCNPGTCNPSPFSQIGLYGNGKPVTSNGITINSTGTSGTVIYMGSTSSQYLQPVDFTTGQAGSLIKLPFLPNSMLISQDGSTIYLGSSQALMTVSTLSNAQGNPNTAVTGNVVALSPDGTTLVVTDPIRQTISLYSTTSSSVTTSYGGVATSAVWSPDSSTVYITTQTGDLLLTHNSFTNWQATPTGENYTASAVLVPSIGAYFAGPSFTDGRSYCASSTANNATNPPTETNVFAPLADENAAVNDVLSATTDGLHILGATVSTAPATLNDLHLTLPVTASTSAACPAAVSTGYFSSATSKVTLSQISAAAITGVVPASNSKLAFVTYTAPAAANGSGKLPLYLPPAAGAGTLTYLTLGNGATAASAPDVGVFSTDNLFFYVGTAATTNSNAADNDLHIFSINGTSATESGVIQPNLPLYNGNAGAAPVNLLVQKPKHLTS